MLGRPSLSRIDSIQPVTGFDGRRARRAASLLALLSCVAATSASAQWASNGVLVSGLAGDQGAPSPPVTAPVA